MKSNMYSVNLKMKRNRYTVNLQMKSNMYTVNLQIRSNSGLNVMLKNFWAYLTKSLSGFFWESMSTANPVEAMTSSV